MLNRKDTLLIFEEAKLKEMEKEEKFDFEAPRAPVVSTKILLLLKTLYPGIM